MTIAIIDNDYDNAILELKQISSDAIEISKYHYKDNLNTYILYIINSNITHMSRVDKIIYSKSLESDKKIKMICDAWLIGSREDFKLR
jgi:hypothetical protein